MSDPPPTTAAETSPAADQKCESLHNKLGVVNVNIVSDPAVCEANQLKLLQAQVDSYKAKILAAEKSCRNLEKRRDAVERETNEIKVQGNAIAQKLAPQRKKNEQLMAEIMKTKRGFPGDFDAPYVFSVWEDCKKLQRTYDKACRESPDLEERIIALEYNYEHLARCKADDTWRDAMWDDRDVVAAGRDQVSQLGRKIDEVADLTRRQSSRIRELEENLEFAVMENSVMADQASNATTEKLKKKCDELRTKLRTALAFNSQVEKKVKAAIASRANESAAGNVNEAAGPSSRTDQIVLDVIDRLQQNSSSRAQETQPEQVLGELGGQVETIRGEVRDLQNVLGRSRAALNHVISGGGAGTVGGSAGRRRLQPQSRATGNWTNFYKNYRSFDRVPRLHGYDEPAQI